MQSLNNLISGLISGIYLCLLVIGCSIDQAENIDATHSEKEISEEQVIAEDGIESTPVFEEVLPDSGLLEGVNPEEIITDDWNNDNPDAESIDD